MRPRLRHVVPLVVLLMVVLGCLTHPDPTVLDPRESRIARAGRAFDGYSAADKRMIREGGLRVGLDERGMYLSRGAPAFHWNTQLGGRWCRAAIYGMESPNAIDAAVYLCDGRIVHIARVEPKLPCWRVSSAGHRAVERAEHFDRLPLATQWELLAGILRRGQTAQDIYVAFGEPYNTGMEAREDGTNAAVQVFLDSTGDSYGLYVTLVDRRVSAWRFPPDRTLTPEAQQRRLDAMEHRLVDQLREMEARSIERLREEQQLLQRVQMQSEEMRQELAVRVEQAVTGPARPIAPARPPDHVQRPPTELSGTNTLTLNGCVYTDAASGALGQRCGDGVGCPDGYACNVPPGVCVPRDQCLN